MRDLLEYVTECKSLPGSISIVGGLQAVVLVMVNVFDMKVVILQNLEHFVRIGKIMNS